MDKVATYNRLKVLNKLGIPNEDCFGVFNMKDVVSVPNISTNARLRDFLSKNTYYLWNLPRCFGVSSDLTATLSGEPNTDVCALVVPCLKKGFIVPLNSENKYYIKEWGMKIVNDSTLFDIPFETLLNCNWFSFGLKFSGTFGKSTDEFFRSTTKAGIQDLLVTYEHGWHQHAVFGLTLQVLADDDTNYIDWNVLALGDLPYILADIDMRGGASNTNQSANSKSTFEVVALCFDAIVVGYRFISEENKYDIDLECSSRLGLSSLKVKKKLTLIEHKGLLVSKSEMTNKQVIKDISSDTAFCTKLLNSILNS